MSAPYRLVYSPEFIEDLREIHNYIEDVLLKPKNAQKQIARIRDATRALCSLPKRHPVLDWEPWSSAGVRWMAVDNYALLYVVDDRKGVVAIVRVLYGARDLDQIAHQSFSEVTVPAISAGNRGRVSVSLAVPFEQTETGTGI